MAMLILKQVQLVAVPRAERASALSRDRAAGRHFSRVSRFRSSSTGLLGRDDHVGGGHQDVATQQLKLGGTVEQVSRVLCSKKDDGAVYK